MAKPSLLIYLTILSKYSGICDDNKYSSWTIIGIIENIIPPIIRIIAATVIIAESLLLNLFESL